MRIRTYQRPYGIIGATHEMKDLARSFDDAKVEEKYPDLILEVGPNYHHVGGWIGPGYPPEALSLSIIFTSSHALDFEPLNQFVKSVPLYNHRQEVKVRGVFKKPGFDDAFNAMAKMTPRLTEKAFIYYGGEDGKWNSDLVDERDETSGQDLLWTHEYNTSHSDLTGQYKITIQIPNNSIVSLTQHILKVLTD